MPVESLESELERARALDVADLADAIEAIGFECTRCGACCKAVECDGSADETDFDDPPDEGASATNAQEAHTATVFPDEVRQLQQRGDYDWRDVARPMPYGLDGDDVGAASGENSTASAGTEGTFEWALATDDCGDCKFYREPERGPTEETAATPRPASTSGTCTVYGDRPLVCQTYPFSVDLGGTDQPLGDAVDRNGMVLAHECEGLGRDISGEEATELAATLKERAIRSLEEAIAVRENYEPVDPAKISGDIVVHDSEGAKQGDGTPIATDE